MVSGCGMHGDEQTFQESNKWGYYLHGMKCQGLYEICHQLGDDLIVLPSHTLAACHRAIVQQLVKPLLPVEICIARLDTVSRQ